MKQLIKWFLLVLFIVFNTTDAALTLYGLTLPGVVELNQFQATQSLIFKLIIPILFSIVYIITWFESKKENDYLVFKIETGILVGLVLFYSYIVVNNIQVIFLALGEQ